MLDNKQHIAVLASGTGSNLAAILDAIEHGHCPADVRLVLSDKATAGALTIARNAGIGEVIHLSPANYENRQSFDFACIEAIERCGCHWIVLAGYMRILSDAFVQHFSGRIINIHPALLPSFPGADGVRDALDYGVKVTGCTVHLVDEVLDGGPILAQAAIEVHDDDDRNSLLQRMHMAEHQLYPQTLTRMIRDGFDVHGRKVHWRDKSISK